MLAHISLNLSGRLGPGEIGQSPRAEKEDGAIVQWWDPWRGYVIL